MYRLVAKAVTPRRREISGGDALTGNTRSHSEHDGKDVSGRWYYAGDGMEEQVAAGISLNNIPCKRVIIYSTLKTAYRRSKDIIRKSRGMQNRRDRRQACLPGWIKGLYDDDTSEMKRSGIEQKSRRISRDLQKREKINFIENSLQREAMLTKLKRAESTLR